MCIILWVLETNKLVWRIVFSRIIISHPNEAQSLRSSLPGSIYMCCVFVEVSQEVSVICTGSDEGDRNQLCKWILQGFPLGGIRSHLVGTAPVASPSLGVLHLRTRTAKNSKFLVVSSWEPFFNFSVIFGRVGGKNPECYPFRFFVNFLAPNFCVRDCVPRT